MPSETTLRPGEITFCVMARAETDEPGRRISASIGIARPADPKMYGYISEHHGFGMTKRESGDYAEDLAATMLASTLGIEFNPDMVALSRRNASTLIPDQVSAKTHSGSLARLLQAHRGNPALVKRLAQGRETTPQNTKMAAPKPEQIHPGVQRYLKEIGL